MIHGWMLLALLAGFWTGLLVPYLIQITRRHYKNKTVKQMERGQEQLLNEWLYGKE